MSLRTQKKKNFFISIINGNKRENHRILINERLFNFNDIKKWGIYLKQILQYINYLCEINDKEIDLFLRDVIKDVNQEAKQFKRKMGFLLGDWEQY